MLLRAGALQPDDRAPSLTLLHPSVLPFLLGSSGAEQRPQGCDTAERKEGRSRCEPWTPCLQIPAGLCWIPACSLSPTLQTRGPDLSLVGKLRSPAVQVTYWWNPCLNSCSNSGNLVFALTCDPTGSLSCHPGLINLPWVSVCLSLRSFPEL